MEILRYSPLKDGPQFGVLRGASEIICLTLELPWNNNARGESCIPEGYYTCVRTLDRKTSGGMVIPLTYEITNVPGRSGILFHVGNYLHDTEGCVLVGLGIHPLTEPPCLTDSRKAFNRFLKALRDRESFPLHIYHV